jgi:hypothetical protein
MANTLSSIASTPVTGLATQTFTVVTAGIYTVEVKYWPTYRASGTSLDSSSTANASQLQVLVKLDASTKLTLGGSSGADPTPTQPMVAGAVTFAATAGQAITVVPSSSAAVDQPPNAVKGLINVYLGS